MARRQKTTTAVAVILTLVGLTSTPAFAADDSFELWINPRATTAIDRRTEIQFESLDQFRDADNGADTYALRLWLIRKVSDTVSIQIGAERRINDGGEDETRLAQQVQFRSGVFQTRARMEQRLVDDSGRMGLRARVRAGVSAPLDTAKRWAGFGDIETFLTIRSTGRGGDDGLTGVRTRIGLSHKFSNAVSASLAYQRQQDVRSNREDRVTHAPVIGIDFGF